MNKDARNIGCPKKILDDNPDVQNELMVLFEKPLSEAEHRDKALFYFAKEIDLPFHRISGLLRSNVGTLSNVRKVIKIGQHEGIPDYIDISDATIEVLLSYWKFFKNSTPGNLFLSLENKEFHRTALSPIGLKQIVNQWLRKFPKSNKNEMDDYFLQ